MDHYREWPEEAAKLLRVGQKTPRKGIKPREVAAYAGVMSVILNTDEAVTKE